MKLFGGYLLYARTKSTTFGKPARGKPMKLFLKHNDLFLKDFVCMVALLASIFAILWIRDLSTRNWAFGTIGLILGRVLGRSGDYWQQNVKWGEKD